LRDPGCRVRLSKSIRQILNHASGAGYFLSRRAAAIAADFLRDHPIGLEDALVGRALIGAGVEWHHDERFRSKLEQGFTPAPSNEIIAALRVDSAEAEELIRRAWTAALRFPPSVLWGRVRGGRRVKRCGLRVEPCPVNVTMIEDSSRLRGKCAVSRPTLKRSFGRSSVARISPASDFAGRCRWEDISPTFAASPPAW
jgi:hypothetical protein